MFKATPFEVVTPRCFKDWPITQIQYQLINLRVICCVNIPRDITG